MNSFNVELLFFTTYIRLKLQLNENSLLMSKLVLTRKRKKIKINNGSYIFV